MWKDEIEALKSLLRAERSKIFQLYNRHVSINDLLSDRWETARFYGFGEGTSCYNNVLILGDVTVGADCWIGPQVILDGSGGGLRIGDSCTISAGVQIYTHDNVDKTLTMGELGTSKAPTAIGSCCYIGPNVVIAKGVTLGDRVVVGANSLVMHDIPSDTKAYGSPCKVFDRI